MTVENEKYREDYNGNDSTTSFPVTFYFLEDSHLEVILRDSAGVETTQVLNTDYTVVGAGDDSGGSVEMVVAPATGETLTILRDVPLTQLYDYIENDNFPAESHETALDKLTMIVQQQQEGQDRNIHVPDTYTAVDTETVPEADAFLVWNSAADKIITLLLTDYEDTLSLNIDADSGSGSVLLTSEILSILGGTGLDSVAGGSNITINIDGTVVTLTGTQTLTNKTIASPWTLDGTANVTDVLDEDNLGSDSNTALATQQSIKAYVDNAVGPSGNTLVFTGDSGGGTILLATETFGLIGGAGLTSVGAGNDITFDLDTTVVLNEIQTATGKTGITLTEDGAINLYYDELKAFSSAADGVIIFDTDGENPVLRYRNDAGVNLAKIDATSSFLTAYLYNGATFEPIWKGTLSGAVELYHANDKVVETQATGLKTLYANEWDKAQSFDETTLTDAASIAWDVSSNQVTKVTITADRTMAAPTNIKAGANYQLSVIQDGTGGWSLTWNAVFKWEGGVAPSLAVGANERTIFAFNSDGTNLYGIAVWTEN